MGRLLILTLFVVLIIGGVMTFHLPISWIGQLPGDFSIAWRGTQVFIPLTTSLIFSFALSIFLFLFARH